MKIDSNVVSPYMFLGLVYGESLMVVLHIWILVGVSLPSLDAMMTQPVVFKYVYLLCDASLPILVGIVAFASNSSNRNEAPISCSRRPWSQLTPPTATATFTECLVAAHTLLYAAFAWDEANMEDVTAWAYSPWSERRMVLPILPGAAVCLDAICHGWGLYTLLGMKIPKTKIIGLDSQQATWTACAVGGAVGACTMSYLSR